jgi:phosphatidylglycerophosphatase A
MKPTFAMLWRHPAYLVAFGGGAGLAAKAPGTVGSLAAVPLYVLCAPLAAPSYVALLIVLTLLGVWACARTERDLGVHDHPGIVWDEVVGMLVTLFQAPSGWIWLLVGFGLFRLFDIWKPFPIGWLNARVPGGWGIMLDDLAAGLTAAACLQTLAWFYGH